MKYEYLIFNLIVFLPVFFIKSFLFPKLNKENKKIIKPIFITGIFFLVKDYLSTGFFWQFNEKYITGIKIFNLPIEEILFFITVPYSTLFVYQIIKFKIQEKSVNLIKQFYFIFSILSLTFSLLFLIKKIYYTAYILVFFPLTVFLVNKKIGWRYFVFMLMVFLLTLIFNYYLTARPVVVYNEKFLLGLRILTIPIEDFFYSFSLFNLILFFY